jgi:hypothetical protein
MDISNHPKRLKCCFTLWTSESSFQDAQYLKFTSRFIVVVKTIHKGKLLGNKFLQGKDEIT